MFFFLNATTTTEIYTLSLHDALPFSALALARRTSPRGACARGRDPPRGSRLRHRVLHDVPARRRAGRGRVRRRLRSEEHTSELQSRQYLVCRLLLEKKTHIYISEPPT